MKVTLVVSLLFVAAYSPSVQAAVGMLHLPPDLEHPGACKITDGIWVKPGTEWYTPGCAVARCDGQGNNMHIRHLTCGLVAAPPPCTMHRDAKKLYPDCCPVARCPKGRGNPFRRG